MLLGLACAASEGYGAPGAGRAFARAVALCRELGENAALFPILFGQWAFYMVRSEPGAMRDLADQMLALVERAGDPGLRVEAHLAMGITHFWAGELEEARPHLEWVLSLYDRERDRAHAYVYGQDPAAYAHAFLCYLLWSIGRLGEGLARAREGLAFAEELAHPFTFSGVCTFFAFHHAFRGELDDCAAVAERAQSVAVEQHFAMWMATPRISAAYAAAARDPSATKIDAIGEGVAAFRATGALIGQNYFLCFLTEACWWGGQTADGLGAVDQALDHAEKHGERFWESEIHRLKGELLLLDGADASTVEARFHRALEISRAQQAKSLELRAAMSLARLWRDQGRRSEARDLLAPVYAWFTEGFDTKDLRDAMALLEELG
ncbi:MAG: hypothetical protein ACREI8_11465 [Myxococcota bacterium]